MKRSCVYCGSSFGKRDSYLAAAKALGTAMAKRDITLVYGGGNIGLMGALADTVMAHKGSVIGVIPQALADREVAHTGITELKIVASMHERKAAMAELADAFIAMPGGFGTLEELSEIITWTQLGIHKKACGLLNIDGFYDGLLNFFDHATKEQFIRVQHREIVFSNTDPAALLDKLGQFQAPDIDKLRKTVSQ